MQARWDKIAHTLPGPKTQVTKYYYSKKIQQARCVEFLHTLPAQAAERE